ncbi:MAG: hypothetical protein NC548_15910 [Lachnospiraceae bacterium]|nr:hypothetical protein [Lachnospiraceae bacterium]
MKERKNELIIVTDDEVKLKEGYLKDIEKINGLGEITIGFPDSYNLAKKTPNRVIVAIIYDIYNLKSNDSFRLSYLISNDFFDAVCTDDNTFLNNFYRGSKILCDIEELINIINYEFNPKDIIVGFVTENSSMMMAFFKDLLKRVKDNNDYESFETNYKNPKSLHFFPTIFKGWIYDVWYGKRNKEPDEDTIPGVATFENMITIKMPCDQSITYVWIKPSVETNILNEMGFHTLYIDIDSHYKLLKLPDEVFDGREVNLIPFIFSSICNCDRDIAIMNMLHNLNLIESVYSYCKGERNDVIDETSKSVYGKECNMVIPKFYHIDHIDPYLDFKEVIINEPDGGTR